MPTTNTIAIDPVCGMKVDTSQALHSEHDEQTYYFCSAGCQKKFEQDPVGVLEVRQQKPAAKKVDSESSGESCCGGSPSENRVTQQSSTDSQAIYTCPMHAEIEQVGPGDCLLAMTTHSTSACCTDCGSA